MTKLSKILAIVAATATVVTANSAFAGCYEGYSPSYSYDSYYSPSYYGYGSYYGYDGHYGYNHYGFGHDHFRFGGHRRG